MQDAKLNKLSDNVKIACQPNFIHLLPIVLDTTQVNIVLLLVDHITEGTDYSNCNFFNFLDHPKITHCFSENWFDQPHPKLTQIPIGISHKDIYLVSKTHAELEAISQNMTQNKDKPMRVFCNAHKTRHYHPRSGYRDDRTIMLEKLSNSPFIDFCNDKHDFSKKRLINTWKKHDNYAFELSPSGTGMDCHRTYEAIILKTIPIVRSNTLDPIYRQHNLPVVIVDEWDEVTEDNLKRWHLKYQSSFTSECLDKMRSNYWQSFIASTIMNIEIMA